MPDIQHNQVHLWFLEDQQIHDQELLDAYCALLNAEEKKRFERFVFPKHKKQFLLSRALVRTVLASYLDEAPESLVFARNAYGKPRIASFGNSPSLSFNLSHTNDLSVLAVTLDHDIGVDVEYLTRKVDILNLARRYFSTLEVEELEALQTHEFNQRFFDLWTLKEAYIKACGMGLAIPLKDFSFYFGPEGINIRFSEEREDYPDYWQFWQFLYQENFQVALALKDEEGVKKSVVSYQGIPLQGFSPFDGMLKNASAVGG